MILMKKFFAEYNTAILSLICTDVIWGLLPHVRHPEIIPAVNNVPLQLLKFAVINVSISNKYEAFHQRNYHIQLNYTQFLYYAAYFGLSDIIWLLYLYCHLTVIIYINYWVHCIDYKDSSDFTVLC